MSNTQSNDNLMDPPPEKILNSEVDFTIDAWVNYTGLKIREHNEQELEAFKKPFLIGWTRDLSIRAQLHSSGKRIVDVSYISPCKEVVLKSYVELGVYLRNDQSCQLEPENFTFAKQPVYKYPEEVIRQLIKQPKPAGGRLVSRSNKVVSESNGQMPQLTPIDESSKDLNQSLDSSFNNSIAEGRSKRRRTAPTRFDDEDYLESLNKKKIMKTQATPTSKLNSSSNSTTTSPISANKSATVFQPLSPKSSIKKEESRQESILNISEDKSNSSFKSAKSSEQQNRPDNVLQLDANSNFLNNETESTNLKENESNESNKKSGDNSDNSTTLIEQKTADQSNQAPKTKPKRKYIRNKDKNPTNSLLNNNMLMGVYNNLEVSNLLQNGNFECEDNDLSDCEMVLPMPLIANQLLPIPPCSLQCGDSTDDIPNLLCSKCLCLFHQKCVSTGIFLKDNKKFICPNCVQPDDLNNAIENSSKQLEKLEQINDEDLNEANVELQISESSNQSTATTSQQINKLQKRQPPRQISIPKQQPNNNIRIEIQNKSTLDNLSLFAKTNGLDNNLRKLKQNPIPSAQIRIQPKLSRNLNNLNSNNLNNSFNNNFNNFNVQANRMKINNQQININQLNQLNQMLNKNQMNTQLMKRMNKYNSYNQNLVNLKSNINQLTNGINPNSSLASRKSHLDTMNKSLQSSQQLIESLKKAAYLNNNANHSARMQLMNKNLNMRFNTRYEQLQRQRNDLNRYNPEYNDPRNDPRLSKYYEYFNDKQNGLKQMIDQYQALDKIFDYLDVRDLIRCKLVNKTFNRLASDKCHWKKLNMKNLVINDWIHFSNEIVEENQSEELCLENLRLPRSNSSEEEIREQLWKDFKSNYAHLQSLNKINFGKISVQHLNYLLTNESNDGDFVNPLYDLEELSIRNLYDKTTDSRFVSLHKLDSIREFKNLRSLRIESKQGISSDESTINFLNNLSESLPKLKHLYLPSLRAFTIENFEFLTKLNQLEVLEIGSCESWTLIDSTSKDEEMEIDNEESNEDSNGSMNENSDSNQAAKRNQSKRHKGAFQYLCQLNNLRKLYLQDVIVDEMECNQLPLCIEKITNLESLGLGLTISPDATQTVNMLCNTLKTKLPRLKQFIVSTDDQFSNKTIFDLLLKRLDNLEEVKWKVKTQVEDSGVCLVPFINEHIESDLENEDNLDLHVPSDSTEMFETCYLNDVLQKHLNKTKIYLLPQ